MIRLSVLLAPTVIFLLAALAACGGGGDDTDDGSNGGADESALARAMLLTLDDFPPGWTEEPPAEDAQENPFQECDPGEVEGKTGEAETGDFSPGGPATVAQEVAIFVDSEAASAALENLDETAECMADVIDRGGLDDDETEFTDARVEDLEIGEFGDETKAFRLSMTVRGKEPNDAGEIEEGDIFFDAVFVIVDRAGIYLQAGDAFSPFPEDDLRDLLRVAEQRARDVLAGGGQSRPTAEPEATDDGGDTGGGSSQDEPVAFGESGSIGGLAEVTVLDVDFDAEDRVLEENVFNEPAEEGHVMVLWRFELRNTGDEVLDAYFDPGYSLVDSDGNVYDEFDFSCGFIEDEIGGGLAPGESTEGNFCIQVDEDSQGLVFVVSLFDDSLDEQVGYFALE